MPQVEPPVIARTDRHDRPIDAAALASKPLWNAGGHKFTTDCTSDGSIMPAWCTPISRWPCWSART